SAVVVLRRARPKAVTAVALPFTDRSAEAGLLVAPGEVASTEALAAGRVAAWGPGRPGGPGTGACVLMVTGQMHKRGRFLGVDLIGADGTVENPAGGAPNPFEPGRSHLFGALDWTDEGALVRPHSLALGAGQALHYACWDDNGAMRSLRLGCEEASVVPPGQVGAPAKPCTDDADCPTSDPAYPGRTFTGASRPATLVAGVGDGGDGGAARVGRPVPDSLRSAGELGRVRPAVRPAAHVHRGGRRRHLRAARDRLRGVAQQRRSDRGDLALVHDERQHD